MARRRYLALPGAFLAAGLMALAAGPAAASGETDTVERAREVWASMDAVTLEIRNADGGLLRRSARLAEGSRERGQGFRHLPPEEAVAEVLFHRLPAPDPRPWHMRHVALPLEVFWMDEGGEVFQGAVMHLGHDLYQPEQRVWSALQAPRGELSALGVGPGSRVTVLERRPAQGR